MSKEYGVVNTPADQRLKAAFGKLLAAAGGPDQAAISTECRPNYLRDMANPNSNVFPPLRAVRDLESVTHGAPGHPHVTRLLALEAGYGLFRLPGSQGEGTVWAEHAAEIAKEANEVVSGLCTDLADGELSPREAKRRLVDVDEAIDALVRLRGALTEKAAEQ